MSRYHKIDGWRGYSIPDLAVAGSSYTGEFSDSPAPMKSVKPELERMRSYLSKHGIDSEIKSSESSNAFMQKLWVVVKDKDDFSKAGKLANSWLEKHKSDTVNIHDADIPKGKKKAEKVS